MSGDAMDRILEQGIKPHVEAIARIGLDGDLAVVVFEPSDEAKPALAAFGWDGKPVFSVNRTRAIKLMEKSDPVTRAWVAKKSSAECIRIFVFVHLGTLLVNYRPGEGYSLEPGSTDAKTLN